MSKLFSGESDGDDDFVFILFFPIVQNPFEYSLVGTEIVNLYSLLKGSTQDVPHSMPASGPKGL